MAPGHAPMVSLSLLALSVVDVVIKGNGIVHCEVEIPEIPINPVIRWRVGRCLEDVVVGDEAALSVLISASGNCTMSATLPTLLS
jgi:hypothetical protein